MQGPWVNAFLQSAYGNADLKLRFFDLFNIKSEFTSTQMEHFSKSFWIEFSYSIPHTLNVFEIYKMDKALNSQLLVHFDIYFPSV